MDVRLKEPQRFRALLVDADEERHRFLQSLLEDRGFLVIATCATVGEISASAQAAADLLILYGATLDHSTVEHIRTARQTTNLPIMLISEGDAPADVAVVIEAGADSILPIGVAADRFRCAAHSAIAIFERIQSTGEEIESLRRELEHRKLIERAKGILMSQRRISEQHAFREIQQQSMERNIPMPDIARSIIAAKELLG